MSLTAAMHAWTETGGVLAELLGQRHGFRQRPTRRSQHVDEADLVGTRRLDRPARQNELLGDIERQGPWRAEEASAGRHDADADFGQAEPGRARRDDEIAGEGDLQPAAQGGTLDGGDQRFAAAAADDAVLTAALRHVVAAGGQVTSRTEDIGVPREDAGPQVSIVVELVEGVVERVGHRPVDGVPLLGPCHRDDQDAAVTTSPDQISDAGGVMHACPSSKC